MHVAEGPGDGVVDLYRRQALRLESLGLPRELVQLFADVFALLGSHLGRLLRAMVNVTADSSEKLEQVPLEGR